MAQKFIRIGSAKEEVTAPKNYINEEKPADRLAEFVEQELMIPNKTTKKNASIPEDTKEKKPLNSHIESIDPQQIVSENPQKNSANEKKTSQDEHKQPINCLSNISECPDIEDPLILSKASWSIDFLYLKATEDSLVYAQKIPQTATYSPVIKYIEQEFSYDPGIRTSIVAPIFYDDWKLRASWTFLSSHPDSIYDTDPNYGIMAGLVVPIIGTNGNSMVQEVSGKWDLFFNVLDFELQKPIPIQKHLMVSLYAGVRSAWIHQDIEVKYKNYLIESSDNTPQKVNGKSHFVGIGPMIQLSANLNLPKNFGLYVSSGYSALLGFFHLSTLYSDLLNTPAGSTIEIKKSQDRVVPMIQIQAGIYKRWHLRKYTWFEFMIGWEEQIWWDQMKMDWFSTIVSQPNGANLTLNGLFFRFKLDF